MKRRGILSYNLADPTTCPKSFNVKQMRKCIMVFGLAVATTSLDNKGIEIKNNMEKIGATVKGKNG
jgi:hypothetical protein